LYQLYAHATYILIFVLKTTLLEKNIYILTRKIFASVKESMW